VQTGAKNIEIAVMTPGNEVSYLKSEEIEKIVEKINTEKDAEAATRRGGRGGATAAAPGSEQVLAERPALMVMNQSTGTSNARDRFLIRKLNATA
jgi:20S proteasome subunit alpha 4